MKLIKNLWICRNNILTVWIFFFCLSMIGKSPYDAFTLLMISGLFSITITSLIIMLLTKSNFYFKK